MHRIWASNPFLCQDLPRERSVNRRVGVPSALIREMGNLSKGEFSSLGNEQRKTVMKTGENHHAQAQVKVIDGQRC